MLKIILNLYYKPVEALKKLIEDDDGLYFPMNGGSGLRGDEWCDSRLNYDDVGDNISKKNKLLNEMTTIYWAWKNYEKLGNPDYIGFNHYRRFFKREDISDYENYDMIISKPIYSGSPYNLRSQYKAFHNLEDLDICIEEIKKLDFYSGCNFEDYMITRGINFAPCNMFVMKKDLFFEWCLFIFPILEKLENRIDVLKRDNYQKRALCFLTERLFGFWCWNKFNQSLKFKQVVIDEELDFKDNGYNERGTYGNEQGVSPHMLRSRLIELLKKMGAKPEDIKKIFRK